MGTFLNFLIFLFTQGQRSAVFPNIGKENANQLVQICPWHYRQEIVHQSFSRFLADEMLTDRSVRKQNKVKNSSTLFYHF